MLDQRPRLYKCYTNVLFAGILDLDKNNSFELCSQRYKQHQVYFQKHSLVNDYLYSSIVYKTFRKYAILKSNNVITGTSGSNNSHPP